MCESKPKVETIVRAGLFPYEAFYAGIDVDRREEVLKEFRAG